MPQGIDPALLMFAGQFLAQGGGDPSNGFGNSLGAGLQAAGGQMAYRQEQARIKKQDLVKAAESSIAMRKAMQEIQIVETQRQAEKEFLDSTPEDQRAAAAVNPQQAALLETKQANPDPLTAFQQQTLNRGDRDFAAGQEQQEFANNLATQQFDLKKTEAALSAKPKMSDSASFRKQYLTESKDYGAVKDGYKNVLTSSFSDGGGVSDTALLFGYMKMLDPGSVVREGEFDRIKLAAGPAAQFMNTWDFVTSGQLLPEDTRRDIRNLAGKFYERAYSTQSDKASGFSEIAQRNNIDPRDITQAVPLTHPLDLRIEALNTTLSDIDETAQKHGLTHQQVVEALEAG
ncbi:hypothetical protein N9980_01885 [bacterium]|nr:hypothetical protein [bacterium]